MHTNFIVIEPMKNVVKDKNSITLIFWTYHTTIIGNSLNIRTNFNNNIWSSTFQIISKQVLQIMQTRPSLAEIRNVQGFLHKLLRDDPALRGLWLNELCLVWDSPSLHFNRQCEAKLLFLLSNVSFSLGFSLISLLALPPGLCLSHAAWN